MRFLIPEYVNGLFTGSDLIKFDFFIAPPVRIIIYISVSLVLLLLFYLFYKSDMARTRRELIRCKRRLEDLSLKLALLEKRSSDINESLNYAHRIQNALLPEESVLIENFSEYFILYMPKDIVSGDFYWLYYNKNKVFLIVADCTGHGVPGALMSMIGHNLINSIIKENPDESTGKILERLDRMVRSVFPGGKTEGSGIKESMDISVCAIDFKTLSLEFSGAFSSVYYFSGDKLNELKGDKYVIGMKPDGAIYSTHRIKMIKGDPLYLFTDGYADQFGGEEKKKFMYRRLRYLLTTINRLPMNEQKIILKDTLENWKGDNEQVDDILIMGIRI